MGINRDSIHKRRLTGGSQTKWRKKRKYNLGRQAANTKLTGEKRIHTVRCRGGHLKYRALRLDAGNFAWPGEAISKKVRIVDVLYNASNNELVRTKTLVKSAIIAVDAGPFKTWYKSHYGIELGLKKQGEADLSGKSGRVQRKIEARLKVKNSNPAFFDQFVSGRLMACISSRPGQSGRCDGYLLEGKELDFYVRKLKERKS